MHEKHCQGVLNGDSCATLFLPAFYGILTAESLSYSKFGGGQQGYKAYSLGLFRVKMFRFFQVLYSEKDGFDRFYIPKRQVLAGLIKGKCQVMSSYCPDRLSNVKFPCPEKVRFYEVL